jgi:hypothetical protein
MATPTEIEMEMLEIQAALKRDGYAIRERVLTPQECTAMIDGMWDHMEYVTMGRLSRHDPSTWKPELQHTFLLKHGMLDQHYAGHAQVAWDVRGHPKVQQFYRYLYDGVGLGVSFDGVSFGLAPEITGIGWHRENWLHLDKGWGPGVTSGTWDPRHNAIQSWVTGFDIDEGDGTLQVLKGSHKLHKPFARAFDHENHKANWWMLTPEEIAWYEERGCELVNITCPAGSQVFWDSRTVHAGRAPVKGRANAGRHRFVIYACYAPRSWLTQVARKKKKKALEEGRMTSHWPQYPKLFPKRPRTYGRVLRETAPFRPPVLTKEQLKLAY